MYFLTSFSYNCLHIYHDVCWQQIHMSLPQLCFWPDSILPGIQNGAVVQFRRATGNFSQQQPGSSSPLSLCVRQQTVHKRRRELLLRSPHAESLAEIPATEEKDVEEDRNETMKAKKGGNMLHTTSHRWLEQRVTDLRSWHFSHISPSKSQASLWEVSPSWYLPWVFMWVMMTWSRHSRAFSCTELSESMTAGNTPLSQASCTSLFSGRDWTHYNWKKESYRMMITQTKLAFVLVEWNWG